MIIIYDMVSVSQPFIDQKTQEGESFHCCWSKQTVDTQQMHTNTLVELMITPTTKGFNGIKLQKSVIAKNKLSRTLCVIVLKINLK